ncbi:MAG: hypothetical protein AB1442_18100, partial [Nitrospirota bacterium]
MKIKTAYIPTLGTALFFLLIIVAQESSYAQEVQKGLTESEPTYGNYSRGDKWGWYGARKVVRN